ncbi:hypothetical protein [uncultured virus]|jgi:hypothetical protein|uniref:Uncharacterized protein n=1 Tax=uncultured virus TaxID=340016 RepID=A0A218MLV8_9VIRU|nr:hypothetical protein [uncultured virus]|tara:strand:- start:237 stop:422 length:186 start_codon:yes stop_codon:yes gene_type:complete
MGQVKQAVLEVEDFVAGCLKQGRTLNQTIRDARESTLAKSNPYLDDEELVENKYYQFKGRE